MLAECKDDVDMTPKPVPIGEDEPPGGGLPVPPPPPAERVVDTPPDEPEPETKV